ncbi:YD repeat-containing protein [Duganella sp. 1411]|uniref:RHS repeat protein n=1 Tax=Duganella sp. 1411 TaxID=2806572 RepID=UPI001AE986C1|nr:RHS repeat protein [Duganella sp. 1411]MBP1204186.1 YD repeat-containing protein [Duganella sp. 1411]
MVVLLARMRTSSRFAWLVDPWIRRKHMFSTPKFIFKTIARHFKRLFLLLATAVWALTTNCANAAAQTPQASTIRYEYDANGNVTRIIDPLGRVTTQRYDTSNRLVQRQLPAPVAGASPPVIAYSHDASNQLTGVRDPRNLSTQYTVDGLGNQTGLASPDTGVTARTFDAAGNLTSARDARGQLTTFDHDALGRITRVAYASGVPSTFEYDAGSAGAVGRLSKMIDESGHTSYMYDNAGRLISKTAIVSGGSQKSFIVGYVYGASGPANGKVVDIAYPSGNHVAIEYGADGRASAMSVLKAGATTPVALLSEIEYQPFGPVRSWQWGNHSAAMPNRYFREFNLSGRLTRFPLGNVLKGGAIRTITYDAGGRITKTEHVGSGLPGDLTASLNQSYAYDDLDRLTTFIGNGTTARYQYDASGNRTQLAYGGQAILNTINPSSNQLQNTTGPLPSKTNVYDAAGNLVTDGTINYIYNARGRLQSAQSGTVSGTYRHNGLDQRASKIVKIGSSDKAPSETTHFIYDEFGQLIGEYGSDGTMIEETVYLGNLPIAILKSGNISEPMNSGV